MIASQLSQTMMMDIYFTNSLKEEFIPFTIERDKYILRQR